MRFRIPNIDLFSFFLGVIISSLVWWLISVLRPTFKQILGNALNKQAEKKAKAHSFSAVEERYRQMILIEAQGMHLAAPLFSLDEIIEPPLLLAPPPKVEPGDPPRIEDITDLTIPYLPSFPELAAIYNVPTLTLTDILVGESDIVLFGRPGMGKTVALASLASRLARRDPDMGPYKDSLPYIIHVADLDLPVNKDNPISSLIEKAAEKASVFDLPRLPDVIRQSFVEGRAFLLLDGLDELPIDGAKSVVEFINTVKQRYPKVRIITTASEEFLDGLLALRFTPYPMASWGSESISDFYNKWGDLWARHVPIETWEQDGGRVDPLLINGWLTADHNIPTPFEITLSAWSAYAGDISGSHSFDGLESHIQRITPPNAPREALQSLALQVVLAKEPIFDPHKARQWVKSFEPIELDTIENSEQQEKTNRKNTKNDLENVPSIGLIAKMTESGLLSQHRNNRMRFGHPIYEYYLAGKTLPNYGETILTQPTWIGKSLALHFLAANGEGASIFETIVSTQDRPLSQNLLMAARWLRDAPTNSPWRGRLMTKLVELLQQNGQPLGLRGQALTAFILSLDQGPAVLFRQLLLENDPERLQLAALGSGALKDLKAVEFLAALLSNPSPNVRRAACLALARIGNNPAMDALASALLHGDDQLRQVAAEAMANHPSEGHKMLREGAELKEDLNVRRAAAYGLGRIHEPWAKELIKKMQIEDDQWIVRNAAMEILEEQTRPNPHIPRTIPPTSESPWLIAFAGKQGMGISPDTPPIELLLLALKSGNAEEKLASLVYLRSFPSEGIFNSLYQVMYSDEPEIREAIFHTLTEMASCGYDLPDPVQFGLGF
jgi:hypothetical protein